MHFSPKNLTKNGAIFFQLARTRTHNSQWAEEKPWKEYTSGKEVCFWWLQAKAYGTLKWYVYGYKRRRLITLG